MTVNLVSLALLLVILIMVTEAMNFLKRVLLKTLYILKALLMQVPLIRRVNLQAAEMEKEAARKKAGVKNAPQERQPTVRMDQEEETETVLKLHPGRNPKYEEILNTVDAGSRMKNQNQGQKRNPKQNMKTGQNP